MPALILAGSDDRIVWQGGWDDARFRGENVTTCVVEGGGHFPWIENPGAVARAFKSLADRVTI
ncbi:MAG: alpha/beta hydrolase [Sphingomonadales bacterium]|nr:alpha/beta hydrolase [Sphingomonadales bacterium]